MLRDKLALERTLLAKERTILAYLRTGLALLGMALFIYRFIDVGGGVKIFVVAVFAVAGAATTLYGAIQTLLEHKLRRRFERENIKY